MLSFLLGIAAAYLAPRLVPHLRGLVADITPGESPLTDEESRLFALAAALLIAAVVAHALDADSAFWLTFGAVVGVFGPRIRSHLRARREPDYGDDV